MMLKDEDCYCPLISDGTSIEKYFHENFNNLNFTHYLPDFEVSRLCFLDHDTKNFLIKGNETLTKVNEVLEICNCMIIELNKNSWVNWHIDAPRKGPVLNLLLTPDARSHSMFLPALYNSVNLIECKYPPHQFVLYNTDQIHAILNFETPRYMFHAYLERGKMDLSWDEAKNILKTIGLLT